MNADYYERMGLDLYKRCAPYRVRLPFGKSGDWSITELVVRFDLEYMRQVRYGRPPGLGKHTALRHRGHIIMSDTAAEIIDLLHHAEELRGHVLISGLGLGMTLRILTQDKKFSDNIKSITVLEKERDVIRLVAPHYRELDSRIRIIRADTFKWKPDRKFDSAWHDIWPDMCADFLEEMDTLRQRYRRVVPPQRQHCWAEHAMRDL